MLNWHLTEQLTRMRAHTRVHMHARTHACPPARTHARAHARTHMHTHAHTYTHRYIKTPSSEMKQQGVAFKDLPAGETFYPVIGVGCLSPNRYLAVPCYSC